MKYAHISSPSTLRASGAEPVDELSISAQDAEPTYDSLGRRPQRADSGARRFLSGSGLSSKTMAVRSRGKDSWSKKTQALRTHSEISVVETCFRTDDSPYEVGIDTVKGQMNTLNGIVRTIEDELVYIEFQQDLESIERCVGHAVLSEACDRDILVGDRVALCRSPIPRGMQITWKYLGGPVGLNALQKARLKDMARKLKDK